MAELEFKAREAEKQREFEHAMKQMEYQMKAMEYAERRGLELEKVKADLTKFALDTRTKKELFAAEAELKQTYGQGI